MRSKFLILLTLTFIVAAFGVGIYFGIYGTMDAASPVVAVASNSPPAPSVAIIKEKPVRITAVGDILLGRGVGSRLKQQKKGFIYPFEKVADILKKGDVVFGNLEESITSSTHSLTDVYHSGKIVLKNDIESIAGINYAGFNMFSLANNHIMDYYDKGLTDTIDILDKNKIVHSGAGINLDEARKPAVIEKNGKKIAMLAYTDMAEILYKGNPKISFVADKNKAGVASRAMDIELIKEDIDNIKQDADILIISLHWGIEESFDVLPEQRAFAYSLLDQGADIIIGHHPHQAQGIEIYKGKPIIYSMGNFIFDQNDPENQESFIVDMEFTGSVLSAFAAIPIRTIAKTQVVPLSGPDAAALLKREESLCNALGTKCRIINDKIVFDLQ